MTRLKAALNGGRLPTETAAVAVTVEQIAADARSGHRLSARAFGVTTGAWIEPTRENGLALIEAWAVLPDFASVNISRARAAAR